MEQKSNSPLMIYLAGIIFIVWGIFGMMDAKNYIDVGYQTGQMSVSDLAAGIYYLKIKANELIRTEKIIIGK